eukprot:UN05511
MHIPSITNCNLYNVQLTQQITEQLLITNPTSKPTTKPTTNPEITQQLIQQKFSSISDVQLHNLHQIIMLQYC